MRFVCAVVLMFGLALPAEAHLVFRIGTQIEIMSGQSNEGVTRQKEELITPTI
jgi:hypothetical protein